MSTAAINALIESRRYSPDILGELVAHLQEQITNKTYHFEANLAILKLYQFHPQKADKSVIAKILIKGLMNVPSTDFLLYSYLINASLQTDESLSKLFKLANHLESGKLQEFWAEAKDSRDLLSVVPEFDDAIRNFIISLITMSYQTISKEQLSVFLNLGEQQIDTLISNNSGWKQSTTSSATSVTFTVTFPASEALQTKSKKGTESFTLEQMAKVLSSIQH